MSTSSTSAVPVRQLGQPRDQAPARPLGVSAVDELAEMVRFQVAPTRQPDSSRWLAVAGYTAHSAWVGDMRAARSAGSSPAAAPMSTAAPMPPPQARAGTTTAQPLVEA
jgi:hypothetical protein